MSIFIHVFLYVRWCLQRPEERVKSTGAGLQVVVSNLMQALRNKLKPSGRAASDLYH